MKLPANTIIAQTKLTEYLLKFRREDDKSLFLGSAGYKLDNWPELEKDLRQQILPLEAIQYEQTSYGDKYKLRGTLSGPNGKNLHVVTIWMIELQSQQTKFITLFPNKEI